MNDPGTLVFVDKPDENFICICVRQQRRDIFPGDKQNFFQKYTTRMYVLFASFTLYDYMY